MPELPDIELYRHCIRRDYCGSQLLAFRPLTPFILRSVTPRPAELAGTTLIDVHRLGKRIALEFSGELFCIVHLMISGRLYARASCPKPGKMNHAYWEFERGGLLLTEASSKKRASVFLVQGRQELEKHRPGGLEVLNADLIAFSARLKSENRTLKRALTSPTLFSGIGNSFSDEILFCARLSPMRLTNSLSEAEIERLRQSVMDVMSHWQKRLIEKFDKRFPGQGDVTAFRPEFYVHGRYGEPCRVCDHAIQRIAYAENECNYCATCQNEGRLLADRSLSRLLKADWPKTIEELEALG